MSGFAFTSSAPSVQPPASSSQYTAAEYNSIFSMGVPSSNASAGTSSISGTMSGSHVPAQQAVPTNAPGFGAFSNPFAAPSAAPRVASTNPFQTNGMVPALMYGGVPPGYGPVTASAVPGGFAGFPQHPFPQQQQQQHHHHQQQQMYAQQLASTQQQGYSQQQSFLQQQQAFAQQHNGAGFGAFGQPKAVPRMMGPLVQGGGAPSNPFMVRTKLASSRGRHKPTFALVKKYFVKAFCCVLAKPPSEQHCSLYNSVFPSRGGKRLRQNISGGGSGKIYWGDPRYGGIAF
ncbi:uncharacterized protein [Scyliorhinus torazame]|uniref:uncharacterized protein n=1 Tax=Scyliorhinus torazame TaxID=75743 RepID=UPI003B5C5336